MEHTFSGQWITNDEFAALPPRNVFHRQLEPLDLPCTEHRNRHILFRKTFDCTDPDRAVLYISADDYYKLYLNGRFVAQGPAPGYHFRYPYNRIDVTPYLVRGKNTLAVHTLYQGLINRVWQSGDNRHGLLLDLEIGGRTVVSSDTSFKTHPHTGYTESGVCGYQTQFLETYDSGAPEVGFALPAFDDSGWEAAKVRQNPDYTLLPQITRGLEFESVPPADTAPIDGGLFVDFGAMYVGYLRATVCGRRGDTVTVRCGQELDENGRVRYQLRANCVYEEKWILGEGDSVLDQFDYKSFRYAELILPPDATVKSLALQARHYPFTLNARLRPDFADDPALRRVWDLCVRTQRYGVQEVIQDCMEREKGFYLGDGCYTVLTHMLLTGDDALVRKTIDDALATATVSDTLLTCMDGSFMQEIAEYPLMLVWLVWWHRQVTGDDAYLAENYPHVVALLEAYRARYEKEGLLRDLDRWCVVEWPKNFQHGYDADITEGQVCRTPHISINAYYLSAIHTANRMADALNRPRYRDETPLREAFAAAFYDPKTALFVDAVGTDHKSLVGNVFPLAFSLCPTRDSEQAILAWIEREGISSLSFFCTFPVLMKLAADGDTARLRRFLSEPGAWLRMLDEGATATFEGWGKDCKWNTSLFHLTLSYAAVFLADTDLSPLFGEG